MSVDTVKCPKCLATNPSEAAWCGQCFASFGTQSLDTQVPQRSPVEPVEVAEVEGPTWECVRCGSANSIDDPACRVCGTSMFDSFGGAEDPHPTTDPGHAMLWAVVPGLGHARAGQGLLGFSVGLCIVLALGFGALFLSNRATIIGALMILSGLVLWLASAMDAYRWADGHTSGILLRPRVVTVAAGLVLGMMVLGFVLTSSGLGQP